MSVVNPRDEIPLAGETVKRCEWSDDRRVVWIYFDTDKVLRAHVEVTDEMKICSSDVGELPKGLV
jgi:hypothetical protein